MHLPFKITTSFDRLWCRWRRAGDCDGGDDRAGGPARGGYESSDNGGSDRAVGRARVRAGGGDGAAAAAVATSGLSDHDHERRPLKPSSAGQLELKWLRIAHHHNTFRWADNRKQRCPHVYTPRAF